MGDKVSNLTFEKIIAAKNAKITKDILGDKVFILTCHVFRSNFLVREDIFPHFELV